jgi:nucleoside 2-deoxyribosyltransferase
MDHRRDASVYVAGALGFHEPGRSFYYCTLLPRLADAGLTALDPWSGEDDFLDLRDIADDTARRRAYAAANEATGTRNAELIIEADVVFAVLDGCDIDSGTAAEIGWAAAHETPVIGWRSDIRTAGDNEAAVVNLQVEYFIHRSGGAIVAGLDDAIAATVEHCGRRAASER